MSSSDILTIKNLEKVYETDSEKLTVLKNLNLTVEQGSKIAVVGESGSGKSTLLNIIAGIDSVTSGTVVAGTAATGEWEVTSLSEAKMAEYRSRFIGLIFQFHYLLKDFTALLVLQTEQDICHRNYPVVNASESPRLVPLLTTRP